MKQEEPISSNQSPQYALRNYQEYQVDQIVGRKFMKDKTFYKIKWKNYQPHEATWEPLSNLKNAWDSIIRYQAKLKMAERHRQEAPKSSINSQFVKKELKQVNQKESSKYQNIKNQLMEQEDAYKIKDRSQKSKKLKEQFFINSSYLSVSPNDSSDFDNHIQNQWPVFTKRQNPLTNMYKQSRKLNSSSSYNSNSQNCLQNFESAQIKIQIKLLEYNQLNPSLQSKVPISIYQSDDDKENKIQGKYIDSSLFQENQLWQVEHPEIKTQSINFSNFLESQFSENFEEDYAIIDLNRIYQEERRQISIKKLSPDHPIISPIVSKFKFLPSRTVLELCRDEEFLKCSQAYISSICKIEQKLVSDWIIEVSIEDRAKYFEENFVMERAKKLFYQYFEADANE